MSTVSFKLRDANNQKQPQTISFMMSDNPLLHDLTSEIAENISGINNPETLRLFNKTKDKELVEGKIQDQICQGDEIIYSSEGSAGHFGFRG